MLCSPSVEGIASPTCGIRDCVKQMSSFGRQGRWQDALSLLQHDLPRYGLLADPIAYGVCITACARCHQWHSALLLLRTMEHERVESDVICWSSAVNACEKGLAWSWAVLLLGQMQSKGIIPNTITYSSVISACEKGLQWEMALQLLATMCSSSLRQDVICYSSATSACAKSAKWDWALHVLQLMQDRDIHPDVITYSSLINACEKALRWEEALHLLQKADRHKLALDNVAYGSAIRACEIEPSQWRFVLELLAMMTAGRVKPDEVTHCAAIDACEKGSAIGAAVQLASYCALGFEDQGMISPHTVSSSNRAACDKLIGRSPSDFQHFSVMLPEVIEAFSAASVMDKQGFVIDCTLGAGGHSEAILSCFPSVSLICLDKDEMALSAAGERLGSRFSSDRFHLLQGDFGDVTAILERAGLLTGSGSFQCHGILADLGVSSPQLDKPERGFSFRGHGPLDMRMDPSDPEARPASWHIANLCSEDLATHFRLCGIGQDEDEADGIAEILASRLVEAQPRTTSSAAEVIKACVACPIGDRYFARGSVDPVQKTFQALRMLVNDELKSLVKLLEAAPHLLVPGGLLCIISFHTIEDTLVRRGMLGQLSGGCVHDALNDPAEAESPLGGGAFVRAGGRGGLRPSAAELAVNGRSRSARLRIAVRRSARVLRILCPFQRA